VSENSSYGACPSPGTAMCGFPNAQRRSDTIASSDIAVPGDGHSPTRLALVLKPVFRQTLKDADAKIALGLLLLAFVVLN